MDFDIDAGQTGGGGPFISWSAKGTEDAVIDPRSFYLRGENGKEDVTERFKKGVVFDITQLKTGWQHSSGQSGVAPTWKWNDSIKTMMPKPGDDYKKGFSIPVALGKDKKAVWEQAGAGAFQALTELAPKIKAGAATNKGLLPLVQMTGAEVIKFSVGSTNYPILEVVKWVPAPPCLTDDIATEPEPAPAKAAPPPDDDEFPID